MSLPLIPKIWSNPQSLFAFLREAGKNALNIIPPSSLEQGYTLFPNFMRNTHVISNPNDIKTVLRDDVALYPKAQSFTMMLDPVIDRSILITHDEKWRTQHKHMISVFNWRNIQAFEAPITETCTAFVSDNIDQLLSREDITNPLQDLTFNIITQILLGTTQNPHFEHLRDVFERYLRIAVPMRTIDFFTLTLPHFPNSRKFSERKLIKEFKDLGNAIIAERLAEAPPETPDFLEHLITAYDCRAHPNDEKRDEIRDNLVTFIIAGHETTAMTLSWALYAAGFFSDTQDAIRAECHNPLADRPHTEAFLNETMRLYPPAPIIVRAAAQNGKLGGAKLKRLDGILIPIISMHRHRDHWEKPDEFMPERFMNGFKPAPYTFLPFGAGPRICIGMAMAMMEAKIILPAILDAIKIAKPTHQPDPHQILTLRSKNGIKIEAERRA